MIELRTVEHDLGTTVYWRGDAQSVGQIAPNLSGVRSTHLTIVEQGTVMFRSAQQQVLLSRGESIQIPINIPYEIVGIALENGGIAVRCEYTKENEGDIAHLKSDIFKRFPSPTISIIVGASLPIGISGAPDIPGLSGPVGNSAIPGITLTPFNFFGG